MRIGTTWNWKGGSTGAFLVGVGKLWLSGESALSPVDGRRTLIYRVLGGTSTVAPAEVIGVVGFVDGTGPIPKWSIGWTYCGMAFSVRFYLETRANLAIHATTDKKDGLLRSALGYG